MLRLPLGWEHKPSSHRRRVDLTSSEEHVGCLYVGVANFRKRLLTRRVFSRQAFSFLGLSFSICQNEELELESLAFKVLIRGPLWAAAR